MCERPEYTTNMDEATFDYLSHLNDEFYRITAASFDETRGQPWQGWERLLLHLYLPLVVLDMGCGNGRFGVFLAQHRATLLKHSVISDVVVRTQNSELTYHGIDNSAALLERARQKLTDTPNLTATLEERDILVHPLSSGEYDLIVLFGVLHHVPGFARRQTLLRTLAQRLRSGGILAFTCWRFYEYERFRERIVSWSPGLAIERHDYLLDWRRGDPMGAPNPAPLRYCHYVDDAEHAALVTATNLTEIDTYRADGKTGDINRYSILRR